MHVRHARYAAVLVALLALFAAACRGGDDDTTVEEPADPRNDFAARVLQLGEPLDTTIDVRDGELVPGLQAVLNPEAVMVIGNAVEGGGEALTLIAETAGMTTAEEFRSAWEASAGEAFARFASGLRAADDPQAIRDELFLPNIASLPVHPDGVLVGSGRIANPDGSQRYFLVFDLVGTPAEIEQTIAKQLDQSPWQATGGQSSEEIAIVQFQSTMSADVQGVAWVQPILASATLEAAAAAEAATEEGDGDTTAEAPALEGPFANLMYLVQALPPGGPMEEDFELPQARPVPETFPAAFLIDENMTVINTAWSTQPGATAYRITILTPGSSFELAEDYRERIEDEGWEVVEDEAVGFATLLGFASEDEGVQGQVQLDAFTEDEGYTQIVISLQVSSRSTAE